MSGDTRRKPREEPTWKQPVGPGGNATGLAEYIDECRGDLEALSEAAYPVSPIVKALLDSRDRGDTQC